MAPAIAFAPADSHSDAIPFPFPFMRRAFLVVSLAATALFSTSLVSAESSASSSSPDCPSVAADIRACEANLLPYETYMDERQCKRAKCLPATAVCPTDAELNDRAQRCQADGKQPEKFNDGRCTVIRCMEAPECPTERQNNDVIAKCKAVGKDYEYTTRNSCSIAQCASGESCPSNYELDRAVAACTQKGAAYEYVNDGSCRRVKCTDSACQENPGFRNASWECYDGFRQASGDEGSCRASEDWHRFAEDACKGRCNQSTGKCGVNSFNVEWECGGTTACGNPSQSCPSMEENEKISRSCSERGGRAYTSTDKNNCIRISCDAESIAEHADSCVAFRERVGTVCETESAERCSAAKQEFTQHCPAQNFRAEDDDCKEVRAKLVRLKNSGHDRGADFNALSVTFADECGSQGDALVLPPASYEEPVLDDEECADYGNPYPDVDQCTDEGKAATELYRRDIATGLPDGTFDGDAPLNRAQTAKFLLRACNLSEDKQSGRSAPDIDSTQWYAPLLRSAMAHGVILGNPDGTVRPGDTVNHAEFTAMLLRACSIQPVGWPVCSKDVQPDDWFASGAAVAEAYQLYPDSNWQFEPGAEQTRKETAVAIYQYLKNRDAAPIPNSNSACFILGDTPAMSSSSSQGDAGFSAGIE